MADDSPNKANIQEMLDNLAKQKQGGSPSTSSGQAGTPANLPTSAPAPQVPQPVKQPQKTTAPPPAPVVSAPAPQVPRPAPPTPATPAQPQPVTKIPTPQDAGENLTNEIRTMSSDVEKLKTGQAPAPVSSQPGSSPQKAVKPPTAEKPKQNAGVPGVVIPEKSSGGMAKKFIYAAVGLIILIIVVVAGLSFFGDKEPTVTPTPIPTPAPTISLSPIPSAQDLSSYFGQLSGTIRFPETTLTREDIKALIAPHTPAGGTAVNVETQGTAGFPTPLRTASSDVLGIEGATLVFGQTEIFDENGTEIPNATVEYRTVYIAEVLDATAANQHMMDSESSIDDDASLFDIEVSRALVDSFSDASYRQIPVRYLNFPYADKSLDWAIVPASNGKNYLVITNSRQSIFFAIDQLLK